MKQPLSIPDARLETAHTSGNFSHIMPGCSIGRNCNIGQNVVISPQVVLGDNVKVQNNVSVYTGVTCGDDVFFQDPAAFLQMWSIPAVPFPVKTNI